MAVIFVSAWSRLVTAKEKEKEKAGRENTFKRNPPARFAAALPSTHESQSGHVTKTDRQGKEKRARVTRASVDRTFGQFCF
jgi:hypothetical protein